MNHAGGDRIALMTRLPSGGTPGTSGYTCRWT